MGRLFLLVVIIIAFITWRRWKKLNTQKARRDFIYKGLMFGLVILIIGLAAFGRIDVLGAVFASLLLSIKFILAFAIRHLPFIARIYKTTDGFGIGKKSAFKTEWLDVKVDFSLGKISGKILKGQFVNAELDDLTQAELERFALECKQDKKSSYIVQAFIKQSFDHESQTSQGSQKQTISSGSMSRDEALEILGLEGSPTSEEIKVAHKKLMQKLHPDRGGNDFLASLLNRARDELGPNR